MARTKAKSTARDQIEKARVAEALYKARTAQLKFEELQAKVTAAAVPVPESSTSAPAAPTPVYHETQTSLANALGVNKSRVCRYAQKDWFPGKHEGLGWEENECRAAVEGNVHGRWSNTGIKLVPAEKRLLTQLRNTTDSVTLARVSVQLAARAYARSFAGGSFGTKDPENLKKALEELRRTEDGCMKLDVARGQLIELDVARAIAGSIARKLVLALDNLSSALATQVEIWLADPAFVELPTEDRLRQVRGWARDQGSALRTASADELDKVIAKAVEESKS